MDALYHQTNRIIQEIQRSFQKLNEPNIDVLAVENDIQTKIITVNA